MKRKMKLFLGIFAISYSINLFVYGTVFNTKYLTGDMYCVYAKSQDVKYIYDSLGRVSTVRYPDGTEVKYEYDGNGNLLNSTVTKGTGGTESSEQEQPGSSEEQKKPGNSGEQEKPDSSGEDNKTGNGEQNSIDGTGQNNNQQQEQNAGNANNGENANSNSGGIENSSKDTEKNIQNYNRYKNKKPVIQSLKVSKSKKKYYLKIQIKQINKRGTYGESGYQIKYATNHRFKQAKTIKISRSKKGSVTSAKWSVKRNKTYYVKARALMKTKTGKVIYSKYSKTVKVKVK